MAWLTGALFKEPEQVKEKERQQAQFLGELACQPTGEGWLGRHTVGARWGLSPWRLWGWIHCSVLGMAVEAIGPFEGSAVKEESKTSERRTTWWA